MERGTEHAKREAREHVPAERVKDPAATARELRWRARIAAGHPSDDEGPQRTITNGHGINGSKRKRVDSETSEERSNFRNFKPRVWESVKENASESEDIELNGRRPENEEEWKEYWTSWRDGDDEEGEPAKVNRRQQVVIKVRRTLEGVERHRIERTVEHWAWKEKESSPLNIDSD
jgi:hypothetical protein